MENTTSRNSIILRNIRSPYIEQAIFILKKEAEFEDDIITEAEKIINNFIARRQKKGKLKRYIKKLSLAGISAAIVISSALIIYFSFRSWHN